MTIEDLRRQLLALGQQNTVLGDKVTSLMIQGKTDAETIAQLRAQLAELTKQQVADDEVDKKRIADLREVNERMNHDNIIDVATAIVPHPSLLSSLSLFLSPPLLCR